MPLPQCKDSDGNYVVGNSDEVNDTWHLIRGVSKKFILDDPSNIGNPRISSKYFDKSSEPTNAGMSANIKELIEQAGKDPVTHQRENSQFPWAVILKISDVRKLSFIVGYTPTDDNPFHADVWWGDGENFPKSKRKALATRARWFIKPIE